MGRSAIGGWWRSIKSPQRLVRQHHIIVTYTTGTPALTVGAGDVTITDTGTGDLLLTFVNKPRRILGASVLAVAAAGDIVATAGTISTTSAQILFWDATDGTTAKDPGGIVYITLTVSDAGDLI